MSTSHFSPISENLHCALCDVRPINSKISIVIHFSEYFPDLLAFTELWLSPEDAAFSYGGCSDFFPSMTLVPLGLEVW